eukprot:g10621.t1
MLGACTRVVPRQATLRPVLQSNARLFSNTARQQKTFSNTSTRLLSNWALQKQGSTVLSAYVRNFGSGSTRTSCSPLAKATSGARAAEHAGSSTAIADRLLKGSTPEAEGAAAPTSVAKLAADVPRIAEKGLVFEFSLMWILTAWKEIAVGVIRNTAYTFRPVALFFVMGYVVKFLFFLMGAPMLVSFYSVWLFEVGYGLAQCFLSVIFLTQLTYMDLSFRGTLKPMVRLQAKKLMDVCGKLAKKMGALK